MSGIELLTLFMFVERDRVLTRLRRLSATLWRRAADWVATESQAEFQVWWRTYERTRRSFAYRPRHSRDDMYSKMSWRVGWSHWDTQFWPTLVTTGNAYDLVDDTTSVESYAR